MTFTKGQQIAYDAMMSGENVFLTGEAGTGKSYVIQKFVEKKGKDVLVCAPTGVAAINVRGVTLHKAFRLPIGILSPNTRINPGSVIIGAKTIIIDEISMCRIDVFSVIAKGEEFIDMDTNYFDQQSIRQKAESVDEKNLYGLYYDYDSSFEHGLWGAIRESSLLKCNNPAHQYHCIPDVEDETRLKTTLPDCIMIMNKTVSYLNELYGIPEQLLNEVINFEIKSIVEQDSFNPS